MLTKNFKEYKLEKSRFLKKMMGENKVPLEDNGYVEASGSKHRYSFRNI